ncbi:hypothetical protein HYU82_00085 [Candidatus Saccharibacteria bacterium]|nr:hypothetical protein [Candidatus Saccharibacteria bacterium]
MTDLGNLLVHPKTKKQADYFLQKPYNPLLILGEMGSGKRGLAYSLACTVLGLKSKQQLLAHPYFFYAKRNEGKQDISIDTVREITRFLRLKTPGGSAIRRVVLIENSQNLSIEAQNALLKILEEPNEDTMFLLTAPYELSLLPTIVSRCQHIWAHPVTLQQADKFYGGRISRQKMESAWRLSRGGSALLDALLTEEGSHPLKQAIEKAKSFLKQSKYERLLFLDQISRDKEELRLFLEALTKILVALHRSALGKRPKQAQNLASDRKLTIGSLESLDKNASPRLICLSLVLSLKS